MASDWVIVGLLALLAQFLYPATARSFEPETELKTNTAIHEYFKTNRPEFQSLTESQPTDSMDQLPSVGYIPVKRMTVEATAYTNLAALTDASPDITASGTRVGFGQIAANFLPFGTKVRLPDLYGDQIFTVTDRMNARYQHRVDVFLPTYTQAIQFGYKRHLAIEVLN